MKYVLRKTIFNRIKIFIEYEVFDKNDPYDIDTYTCLRKATPHEVNKFLFELGKKGKI